jgi:hypothetical protein
MLPRNGKQKVSVKIIFLEKLLKRNMKNHKIPYKCNYSLLDCNMMILKNNKVDLSMEVAFEMSFKIQCIVTIFHLGFFLFSKHSNKSLLIKEYFYYNTF